MKKLISVILFTILFSVISFSQNITEFENVTNLITEDFADAVIIGGGPLASAAKDLKQFFDIPIIEPIPEAVRYLSRMISDRNK